MEIAGTCYKDVEAVQLKTEKLTATYLPELGGKCASLRDTATGKEYLEQDKGNAYRKLEYGGDYVAAECSAFDDMFPSINECYYDRFPWKGVEIPNHGELCGLKWQHEIKNDTLRLWTFSPRFGYCFEKTITEGREGRILVNYRVKNNTQFELDFIYAPHCMIAAEEGGRLVLPGIQDGESGTLIFSTNPKHGAYGSPFMWQSTENGVTPASREQYKFFFDKPQTFGRIEYQYPDGNAVAMEYEGQKLPYLAFWVNYNVLHDLCNVCFEPCSGSFDRPDLARKRGQYSVLPAYGEFSWFISFNAFQWKG